MKTVQRDRVAGRLAANERLLTKIEAAERLNVGIRFIERIIEQRRIRYVCVGRFHRIPESAIDEFIARGTVDVSPPRARALLKRR